MKRRSFIGLFAAALAAPACTSDPLLVISPSPSPLDPPVRVWTPSGSYLVSDGRDMVEFTKIGDPFAAYIPGPVKRTIK